MVPLPLPEDKPCNVCGGTGFAELIVTCFKCKIAREHAYCMRILHMEVADDWVCESCELENIIISPKSGGKEDILPPSAGLVHHDVMPPAGPSKVLDYSGWLGHSKRQKAVDTGKVKFIPNEEVIRLSSGVTPTRFQLSTFSRKRSQSNFMAPVPQRTSFGPKIVTPKSPTSVIKVNPSIIPSRTVKSPRCGVNVKMQSLSKIIQQTSPISKESKEPKAPLAQNSKEYGSSGHPVAATSPAKEVRSSKLSIQNETKTSVASGKERVWEKQPTDVLLPSTDVETSYKKMETATEKEPRTVSMTRNLSPVSSPDDEERYLLNIFASLNLNQYSCLPAIDIPWKGGFILDREFIGGFKARPPCKVHPKALKFLKKMPPVIKADLLPRLQLWTDLFQDKCPDLQDIALYFFPDENIERSRENHDRLLECLENQDSMVRICFDSEGVELLIFTSGRLQLDSWMASFLWGVFHPMNKDHAHYKVHEGFPSMVDQANMDGSEIVDMEIDMIGGRIVGRVDIVVSRDPEMKTRYGGLQTNSGKEEGEISGESEEELVGPPPGFHKCSPHSATGSTDGMFGTSSTVQHGDSICS